MSHQVLDPQIAHCVFSPLVVDDFGGNSFIANEPYMAHMLVIRYATRCSTKMVQSSSIRMYIFGKPESRAIFSKFECRTIMSRN